eukprot:CAMPEP_0116034342 /NCGR_PEP_ID=MMETSP0321-20121206/19556_1 /TAXON_ID=163516 /ORGANISM="Leptocylindrus danicus var. danicus, Strain B650" /LENGTH=336 /DNA_ID=CAMNT_0003510647 /DNA_START=100 /DNA_END=1111 /DNA_ORIENTATION=+
MTSEEEPSKKRKQNDDFHEKEGCKVKNPHVKTEPTSALCDLIETQDWKGASLRIESNPQDIYWVDTHNSNVLHHLCSSPWIPQEDLDEVIEKSVPAKIQIIRKIGKLYPEAATQQNKFGITPFHVASINYHLLIPVEILESLLEMVHDCLKKVHILKCVLPIDIETISSLSSTLLYPWSLSGTSMVAQRYIWPPNSRIWFLLQNSAEGAITDSQDDIHGGNPIHEVCRALRHSGFDFELPIDMSKVVPEKAFRSLDIEGNTPLHCATADECWFDLRQTMGPLDEANIVMVAQAYPEALEMRNVHGKTPLSTNTVTSRPELHRKLENILRESKRGNH